MYASATAITRASSGIRSPASPSRIARAVDPLVVGADDRRPPRRSPRPRRRMRAPISECSRISAHSSSVSADGLLQHLGGHADLADVVHQAGQVHQLDLLLGQAHLGGDVPRVDGDGGRMAGRVGVPRVERRDHRGGEAEVDAAQMLVRVLEPGVGRGQLLDQLPLLGEHAVAEVRRQQRDREERQHDHAGVRVGVARRAPPAACRARRSGPARPRTSCHSWRPRSSSCAAVTMHQVRRRSRRHIIATARSIDDHQEVEQRRAAAHAVGDAQRRRAARRRPPSSATTRTDPPPGRPVDGRRPCRPAPPAPPAPGPNRTAASTTGMNATDSSRLRVTRHAAPLGHARR